jgi:hypothetical protein
LHQNEATFNIASHFHADAPECHLTGNSPDADFVCLIGCTLVAGSQLIKIWTKKPAGKSGLNPIFGRKGGDRNSMLYCSKNNEF